LKELYLGGENEKIKGFIDSDQESSEDDSKPLENKQKGLFSILSSSIKNLTGNKVITNEDLDSILNKFKEDLMSKNVAEEISQKLCDSIRVNLVEKKTEAFTTLYKTVKSALEESLTKILTPKKNIDIISEALKKREQGKPYVITFIGVNGVGKSTNLAKIAYLFKKEGFSLMLAACDNFRAGAVEQIKTHGRCLDVPVFDRGYKEEPPEIAQKAIREVIFFFYLIVLYLI
jgi:signal recognition particle receptor subunit alpha